MISVLLSHAVGLVDGRVATFWRLLSLLYDFGGGFFMELQRGSCFFVILVSLFS